MTSLQGTMDSDMMDGTMDSDMMESTQSSSRRSPTHLELECIRRRK